jgi:hypothetical protein
MQRQCRRRLIRSGEIAPVHARWLATIRPTGAAPRPNQALRAYGRLALSELHPDVYLIHSISKTL